ncbi:MAG: hypothetical protein QOJ00_2785 [Actinomycetota bacterium]|jgi:hypothetical protein
MTARSFLLTVHIVSIASWLGADVVQHAMRRRWQKESREAKAAWARLQFWLHDRYYAIVVVFILISGVGLVQNEHLSWSSKFVDLGLGTVVVGAALGGIGLKGLAKKRVAAFAAGDDAGAEAAAKRSVPIEIFVTALVIVTVFAMVKRWGAV